MNRLPEDGGWRPKAGNPAESGNGGWRNEVENRRFEILLEAGMEVAGSGKVPELQPG